MQEYWTQVREFVEAQPEWVWPVGGAVALLLILWLLYRAWRQPREILAFSTERGRVTVVRRAIADLIQKAAARTPGVEKCKSRIKTRRGRLRIRLRIHLRANYDLREVERKLESQISDTLRYSLGVEHLGKLDTRVVALVGDPDPVMHYEELPTPKESESLRRAPQRQPSPPPPVPEPSQIAEDEERRERELAQREQAWDEGLEADQEPVAGERTEGDEVSEEEEGRKNTAWNS